MFQIPTDSCEHVLLSLDFQFLWVQKYNYRGETCVKIKESKFKAEI